MGNTKDGTDSTDEARGGKNASSRGPEKAELPPGSSPSPSPATLTPDLPPYVDLAEIVT